MSEFAQYVLLREDVDVVAAFVRAGARDCARASESHGFTRAPRVLLASSRRLRVLEWARGLLRSDLQPDLQVLTPRVRRSRCLNADAVGARLRARSGPVPTAPSV